MIKNKIEKPSDEFIERLMAAAKRQERLNELIRSGKSFDEAVKEVGMNLITFPLSDDPYEEIEEIDKKEERKKLVINTIKDMRTKSKYKR